MDAHEFANRITPVFVRMKHVEMLSRKTDVESLDWKVLLDRVYMMNAHAKEAILKLESMDKEIAEGVRDMKRRSTDKEFV